MDSSMVAAAPFQCFTCSAQFSRSEELQRHVWHFQTELATVMAKLQQLLAHRGPFSSSPRAYEADSYPRRRNDQHVQADQQRPLQTLPSETYSVAPEPIRTSRPIQTRATHGNRTRLRCPHNACSNKPRGYTRRQDLVRHYAEHLNVNEYCHFCARTFEAYKYMKHHCIKTGPENQIQYTTARITALRTLSKTELEGELRSNHRYMNNSPLASKQIDSRSPPDTDSASTTVSSSSPPPEAPQPSIGDGIGTTASLDLQYSRQTASLPINGEGYNSQGFPPLFWPLDSSEEVQFPAPLWTIWPESTQAGVWSLNRGPLESAVNFRAQARTIADPTESPHDV